MIFCHSSEHRKYVYFVSGQLNGRRHRIVRPIKKNKIKHTQTFIGLFSTLTKVEFDCETSTRGWSSKSVCSRRTTTLFDCFFVYMLEHSCSYFHAPGRSVWIAQMRCDGQCCWCCCPSNKYLLLNRGYHCQWPRIFAFVVFANGTKRKTNDCQYCIVSALRRQIIDVVGCLFCIFFSFLCRCRMNALPRSVCVRPGPFPCYTFVCQWVCRLLMCVLFVSSTNCPLNMSGGVLYWTPLSSFAVDGLFTCVNKIAALLAAVARLDVPLCRCCSMATRIRCVCPSIWKSIERVNDLLLKSTKSSSWK